MHLTGRRGGHSVGKDGLKFHGDLWNQPDNRRVKFAGETKDGKTGRVTLDGKEYDLADGTLFLVSARRGYRVKQLKRDMARFQDAKELFLELAKNDPDLREFFPRAVATLPDGSWTSVGKDRMIRLMDTKTDKILSTTLSSAAMARFSPSAKPSPRQRRRFANSTLLQENKCVPGARNHTLARDNMDRCGDAVSARSGPI